MIPKLKKVLQLRELRWSLMAGAIFWTMVYKLSESGVKVPDFVYVNF